MYLHRVGTIRFPCSNITNMLLSIFYMMTNSTTLFLCFTTFYTDVILQVTCCDIEYMKQEVACKIEFFKSRGQKR